MYYILCISIQNLLEPDTFIKFQKMLTPESTMNLKISAIKSIPFNLIRKYATAISDKEEYVITKGEDM